MANSEDVLEAARNHTRDFTKFDRAFQEYHLAEAHLIAALAAEVRELRDQLRHAETEIERLRSLLRLCKIECGELHHAAKDRHKGHECPVVDRINAAMGGEKPDGE